MSEPRHVLSDDARKRFREILDDVEHHGAQYQIRRYQTPAGVLVPADWFERARALLETVADDCTVVLTTRRPNDAQRLRRLVLEHGSLGIPFPNNTHPDWQVVDRQTGEPVGTHSIPSVGVKQA
jgi:PHD/YefM family antitoxin component YafN of YafNO toxin-antitoxin module